MREPSRQRKILSWHLNFPEFERNHWWEEKQWEWILSSKNAPKSGDESKQSDDFDQSDWLNCAIAWETLRRHPHTRELLVGKTGTVQQEPELSDPVWEGLSARLPQMIKVWLSSHGLKSWDTLPEIIRVKFRSALRLPRVLSRSGESTAPEDGNTTRIRGHRVRDLSAEAVARVCFHHKVKHESGTPYLHFTKTPRKMTTEEEIEEMNKAFSDELQRSIHIARADGYRLIPIAASPGVTWPSFRAAVRKMYDLHFPDADNSRVREEPLHIIGKFESGSLKRVDDYGKKVGDLRPYRKLIEKYSKLYGFPDPLPDWPGG